MTPTPEQPEPGDRDAITLGLLRARDAEGLRRLLRDHGGVVLTRLRSMFRRTLADNDLEQILSDAIERVWATSRSHDPQQGTLRAWLLVIVRNRAIDYLRQHRRHNHAQIDFAEVVSWLETSPSQQERLRRIADFQGCLRLLPGLQRLVLQADLDADGTASAQVLADRFHIKVAAVYRARTRGRAEVRRMMQRLGHFPGAEDGASIPATRPEPELGA